MNVSRKKKEKTQFIDDAFCDKVINLVIKNTFSGFDSHLPPLMYLKEKWCIPLLIAIDNGSGG